MNERLWYKKLLGRVDVGLRKEHEIVRKGRSEGERERERETKGVRKEEVYR